MPKIDDPPTRAEVRARAERARAALAACTLCEHRCGADRLRGERVPCGLGEATWSFKRHLSFAEEPELLPSYMVYLDGCNLRCRFCVQAPTCFDPEAGMPVDAASLAAELVEAVRVGARSVNMLGGEPSLHVHMILAIAAEAERPLPLVLNTNMYMTQQVLELLDGVIDTYVADFKFGNDDCAARLAGVPGYRRVVQRNLLIADRQAALIVRHLLMPGHFDCCFLPVARWMAAHLPGARFSLMGGYVPAWRTSRERGPMGQTLAGDELERGIRECRALGLRVDEGSGRSAALPDAAEGGLGPGPGTDPVVTVRIDRRGRVYFHDITRDLLPVTRAMTAAGSAAETEP